MVFNLNFKFFFIRLDLDASKRRVRKARSMLGQQSVSSVYKH